MAKFTYEVVAKGRINITVEADSAAEAENLVYDSPAFPNFDKIYDMDVTLID